MYTYTYTLSEVFYGTYWLPPDWVLKHKQKGTEIRLLNGNYYLYKYHSIRINGIPKKITDAYLGKITASGIIPPTIKPLDFVVKEYFSTAFVYSTCQSVIIGTFKRFPKLASLYLPYAFFQTLFDFDEIKWHRSYLSVLFPIDSFKPLSDKRKKDVERIASMLVHHITKFAKNASLTDIFSQFSDIYIVCFKDNWYLATVSEQTKEHLKKLKISLEINDVKN